MHVSASSSLMQEVQGKRMNQERFQTSPPMTVSGASRAVEGDRSRDSVSTLGSEHTV